MTKPERVRRDLAQSHRAGEGHCQDSHPELLVPKVPLTTAPSLTVFYAFLFLFLYKQVVKVFNHRAGDELNIQVVFVLWVNIVMFWVFFQMNFLKVNSGLPLTVQWSDWLGAALVIQTHLKDQHSLTWGTIKPYSDDYNASCTWARSHRLKMRLLFMLQQNLLKCLLHAYPAIQILKRNPCYLFSCLLLERIWGSY